VPYLINIQVMADVISLGFNDRYRP
jgi:hypothetical protein